MAEEKVFDDVLILPDDLSPEQTVSVADAWIRGLLTTEEAQSLAHELALDGRVEDRPDRWAEVLAVGIILFAAALAILLFSG